MAQGAIAKRAAKFTQRRKERHAMGAEFEPEIALAFLASALWVAGQWCRFLVTFAEDSDE
jgi:hypothetical protein